MLDWLLREGGIIFSWWALVTLAGVAAFPLCVRLLGGLPDRGYTLARAAGLLLVAFTYWLLASMGFLVNSTGGMMLSWLIVLLVGVMVYLRADTPFDVRAWWRENRTVVIVGEILFAVLLLGWAIFRAHQNGLVATEKPMELMFMSGIMRSVNFPPHDPWMSGYAISYYYFGYVMSAMLAMLSGVHSTVGFNMTIALLFSLTGLSAFGVGYNLVRSRAAHVTDAETPAPTRRPALIAGLLATVFVVLMGNFQLPLVELPYQTGAASESYLEFWGMNQRDDVRAANGIQPATLDPQTWDFWWWFRSARVISDRNLDNSHIEVIDEFPQFSFLLSDNHPHVLALPFVMLAMGMALNLLLTSRRPNRSEIVFYALCIGGLAFLNTWDGPVYLIVLVGADALRRLMRDGNLSGRDWRGLVIFGAVLLVLGIALYLPFWLGFRSQASGALPNLINPTWTPQFFLMFAPFLLLLTPFLLVEAWRGGKRMNWGLSVLTVVFLLVALIAVVLVMVGAASLSPSLRNEALRFVDAAGGWQNVVPTIINRRLATVLTTLLPLLGVLLVMARLFPPVQGKSKADNEDELVDLNDRVGYPPATGFALLLVGVGLVLVLTPEFVYLRDNFATRMNTIFKFYYQAWLVFSIASAYGVYSLLADHKLPQPGSSVRAVYGALTVGVLFLGLLYPIAGVYSRMLVETGRLGSSANPLTLDGGTTFTNPDDYESIMCFDSLIQGDDVVVAEAIGPAYRSEYGRVAALSGVSIVLGWENHEGQWRGSTYGEIAGTRAQDIPRLYEDPRWETAQQVINQYGIDYIFFGQSERSSYGSESEEKFMDHLEVVCERGGSKFYRVPDTAIRAN